MKCKECSQRFVFHPKYGDMTCIKKFVICSLNPDMKLNPNSKPKWCPMNEVKK